MWFDNFFSSNIFLFTVASLLGPDKRYTKASSDIHLSFFIVLSDFFSRKTLFLWLQAHRTTTTVQLTRPLFISSQINWIKGLDHAKSWS